MIHTQLEATLKYIHGKLLYETNWGDVLWVEGRKMLDGLMIHDLRKKCEEERAM